MACGASFQILDMERKLTVMILDVISLDVNLCKTGVLGIQLGGIDCFLFLHYSVRLFDKTMPFVSKC